MSLERPPKRFQTSDISQIVPTIDLTLSDGDSDDDIQITGFREVRHNPGSVPKRNERLQSLNSIAAKPSSSSTSSKTQVQPNVRQLAPKPPQPQPQPQLQPYTTPQAAVQNQVPVRNPLQPPNPPKKRPTKPLDIKRLKTYKTPKEVPPEEIISESPFELMARNMEERRQLELAKVADIDPYKPQPISYKGELYHNEKDVINRESLLQRKITKTNKNIESVNHRINTINSQVQEQIKRRQNLKRLGFTSTNNPQYSKLAEELTKSNTSLLDLHRQLKTLKTESQNRSSRYLTFINREKKLILDQLKKRPAPPPRPAVNPGSRPSLNTPLLENPFTNQGLVPLVDWGDPNSRNRELPIQSRPHNVPGMNKNNNNIVEVRDGDFQRFDEDSDEMQFYREMLLNNQRMEERRRFEMNDSLQNIYTSDTTDLRHLLETAKVLEADEEGESLTPDELTINLLKHQRRGLKWLQAVEADEKKRGGILGDDMGLGKTVQMIALMMANKSVDQDQRTNLIICPVSLMNQWQTEIETKIKESATIKTFIYHGFNRHCSFDLLNGHDVVITSYGTLANELKKHLVGILKDDNDTFDLKSVPDLKAVNEFKKNQPNCYKSPFFDENSNFHRVILDEAQIIKNPRTRASIACATLQSQYRWCLSGTPLQNNIGELFPLIRFLQIKPYCNQNRFLYDIQKPLDRKSRSDAYDDYDKDKAVKKVRVLIRALMLRREKNSLIDGQPILELPEKIINIETIDLKTNTDEYSFYSSLEAQSKRKAEHILNGKKAKGTYSSILALLMRLRQACLHSELVRIGERKKGAIYDDDGELDVSKPTIKSMITIVGKLKPDVVKRLKDTLGKGDEVGNDEDDKNDDSDQSANGNQSTNGQDLESNFQCPICWEDQTSDNWTIFYPCGHGICKNCIDEFFEKFRENSSENGVLVAKCSQCRVLIKQPDMISFDVFNRFHNLKQSAKAIELVLTKNIQEVIREEESIVDNVKLSPKLKQALDLIKKIHSENPNEKIILFSEFVSIFEIFVKFLRKEGIDPLLFVGSMQATARNETVKTFYRDATKNLMLVSLKAGNVGLTLTCANHVIILDPFWNPFVEQQAQDRVYRIGQTKVVNIYRLLAQETIEDRIVELQNKKKELVESAMGQEGRKEAARLDRRELGYLFGLNDL